MFKYFIRGVNSMYNVSTKQKIYETAKLLFIEEGYAVGSRKIANEAGVNQGLITYYFQNKKNIAMMVLKESFEIIATHIKYFVDPKKDILLFLLIFSKVVSTPSINSSGYIRFVIEISKENLIEESVRFGNNQTEYYRRLVKEIMPPNGKCLDMNISIFLGIVFGIQRNLILRLVEDVDFSQEELFDIFFGAFLWALNLDYTDGEILQLRQKVDEITAVLYKNYPDLKKPEIYLFQEKKLKNL
ncbi:TetR/AcrR family transcriptional regulator [Acetobacterium sp. KB-1]|jgi:Transcriptional regulator|nr:TetR/AcrR family transcriptional regulator [Acetobacterium sp. KB-1]